MRDYVDCEIAELMEITPAVHKAKATLWRKTKWALSNFLVTTMDYTVTRRINLGQE